MRFVADLIRPFLIGSQEYSFFVFFCTRRDFGTLIGVRFSIKKIAIDHFMISNRK